MKQVALSVSITCAPMLFLFAYMQTASAGRMLNFVERFACPNMISVVTYVFSAF